MYLGDLVDPLVLLELLKLLLEKHPTDTAMSRLHLVLIRDSISIYNFRFLAIIYFIDELLIIIVNGKGRPSRLPPSQLFGPAQP